MYHNLIPQTQRQEYIDLLTKAERLLPSLLRTPENLPLIRKAASAVRGSETLLGRIKPPLTKQHVNVLADLLKKSRTYVNNFWTPLSSVAEPQTVNSQLSTSNYQPTSVTHIAVPQQSLLHHTPLPAQAAPSPILPIQPINPQPSSATHQLPTPPTPTILPDRQTLAQYVDTLTPKLQRQAAILPQKYAELNDLHETLDRLVTEELKKGVEKSADAARERAYYAKQIDLVVHTIDAFWLRIHAERQAQQGKPVTEEYQKYLNEEEQKFPMDEKKKQWGDYTKAEIDQIERQQTDLNAPAFPDDPNSPTIRQLMETRQERDRKLCRRVVQNLSARAKQERINAMQELYDWGLYIEKKQWEGLKANGIEVPEEFVNPILLMTEEEYKEHCKARDRKRKREPSLEVKLKIKSQLRAARAADNPYKQ